MRIYDEAHALAKAIKESSEYKRMVQTQKRVMENPKDWEMVTDYMKKQMEVQTLQMMGQEPSQKQVESFNQMTGALMAIPAIAEYFQAQYAFSQIYQDVMKIITEGMDLGL
ncbi:YlbF family regulator [Alkalibacter rhizosphaerae]|uniref:YlbF family regulator n=1 Tax=Alkalibacter rhizosphaerae TaxID=2815577 RepID=A0A974XHB1_9FIRM|nr:YlbF family regulator [Alkalibacter rhizosphaerae]QSX08660.1 YlbF family regulator [Alkalibacter rhizosphaerae]